MLEKNKYLDVLRTELQRGRAGNFEEKRTKRIIEALSLEEGTPTEPRRHIIAVLPDKTEVYFLKPGKEAYERLGGNPHDMTPLVGDPDLKLTFEDIWACLTKISLIDEGIFKMILVAIYRVGYMLDHKEVENNRLRYLPTEAMQECLQEIGVIIDEVIPFGSVLGLLHFLDILGWNEDVKYHTEDGEPTFSGRFDFKVGRRNTILSCISVPCIVNIFLKHILFHKEDHLKIEPKIVLNAMQRLSKSRGVCVPTQGELVKWLGPYLYG